MSRLFTIGHSTRALDAFLALLREHDVGVLVDVRRHPASRRHPHFGREPLAAALGAAGVDYRHEPALGGRRSGVREDSPNGAWRSRSFQAYADHAASPAFRGALERLERDAGRERRPAVTCAEIVPWRCHRQIIADHLVARGHEVIHILEPGKAQPHELAAHARIVDGKVVYPPEGDQLEML